jgi:hypothetical protein
MVYRKKIPITILKKYFDFSRRFPVYWKLELNQQKQGEIIKEVLQHGGRKFEEFEF